MALVRGVDRLHDRPCRPLASTALPHAQVYGEQALVPRRYATARRISSSSLILLLLLFIIINFFFTKHIMYFLSVVETYKF